MDLSSLSSKLLPGFTTLGFKDERRGKGECGGQVGVGCASGVLPRDPPPLLCLGPALKERRSSAHLQGGERKRVGLPCRRRVGARGGA